MTPPTQPPLPVPLLTVAVLERALSPQRLASYARPGDTDEVDAVSRYLWNMALAATLQPTLHLFEVALRNAIYGASLKLVDCSRLNMPDIPCWLDARDSKLLYAQEAAEVARAKGYLGTDRRRRTAGHLIAKLGLGFWVQLTARVYNELRVDGPRLWPRGLPLVFPARWPPGSKKVVPTHADRENVYRELHAVRELRNRAAHHDPVWKLDLAAEHARVVRLLGWMSPRLAQSLRAGDAFPAVLAGGAAAYRAHAEGLLRGGAPES